MTTHRSGVFQSVRRAAVAGAGLLALALGACGGNDIVLPSEGVAAAMTAVQGDKQSGSAGSPLTDSLVVKVVDTKSRPVGDQTVVFQVLSGGGEVVPDTAITDESGLASTQWVLGTADGTQSVRARAVGNGAGSNVTVTFTATAGAAGASTLAAVKGDIQTATAGSPLPDSLIVKVTDQFGNPVSGVAINWTLTGGGTVSAPTVETGADGQAGIVRTLGPTAGQQTTVATATGLTGSPVTFTATATVGTAGRLTLERAPSSSGQSGVPLGTQPQLQLRDANGNPVSRAGVAVQAQIASGPAGSSVSGGTAATDATGLATFTALAINGAAGDYVLNFFGSQLSGVNSSPITITAGSATKLAVLQAPSATAASGEPFAQQPKIELRDAADNPVHQSGVLVTATLQGGGATLSGDNTQTTDANGVATFTDLELTGPTGTKTILFGANGVAGTTAQVTLGAGSPSVSQSSVGYSATTIAAGGTITINVTVKDASGNPIAGAAVGVNSSGTGNTTAGGVTGAGGTASATFSSTVAEGKTLTVTANGVTLDTKSVTVTPAAASAAHSSLAVTPLSIVTGQEATATVTVRDQFDNAVSGVAVTLNVSAGLTVSDPAGSSNGSGIATGKVKANAAGNGTVTATVGGGTTSPPVSVSIAQAATTTSVSVPGGASDVGEAVTVNYSVSVSSPGSGTPGGTVTVTGGSQTCSGAAPSGSCQLTFSSAGTKTISASYGGDANYLASTSSTVDHTVNAVATTTTVTSSKTTSVFGESVTFTATVSAASGTPAGTVNFKSDGAAIGSGTLSSGSVSISVSDLEVGSHTITADYAPSGGGFTASTGTLSSGQTVSKASVNVVIDSTVPDAPTSGSPVTVYVNVTAAPPGAGTPSGTVDVSGGGASCTISPLAGGKGSCSFTPATSGSLTATYNGDDHFNTGASAPISIASADVPTMTTLAANTNPAVFGDPVVFTASVRHGSTTITTGSVQFSIDGTDSGPPVPLQSDGTAEHTATLAAGPHTVRAAYGGGGGFDPSDDSITENIQQASTTTAVTLTPDNITDGQSSHLTATVASSVTVSEGAVQFRDGDSDLGTPVTVADGTATLSPDPTFTGPGPHDITAVYTGSTNFAASAPSPTATLTVNPAPPPPPP